MNRDLEMRVFVAVVEAGSFVAASEGLRMSKAAVSRHVEALERRLGARLLHRTTRRLSLTEEGKRFYPGAKAVLADISDVEALVSQDAKAPQGRIRINVPVSFGISHLAPRWGDFLAMAPKVELDISLSDRVVDLVEEGFDVAVRIGRLPSSSLVSRRLASTRMRLCAAPAYLAKHGTPQQLSELTKHRVLSYSHWSEGDDWTFEGPQGAVTVRTQSRVYSNNGDTCQAIALAGGGIVLQPDFMVGDDLKAGRLVELLAQYKAPTLGIYVVYPSRKLLPTRVKSLVNFLVQQFEKVHWQGK
ncbi:LysR family transcriptional regulator [Gallaecimonas mangrovi]|uniref:LysR family transcriptional regulator n=1 Tax=Gallaecimonas mangrovi TaxID=2291597 RepID=UPI000E204DDF|nr:LysR family transcriptional regulator [Gallaecimonas mangrovi]